MDRLVVILSAVLAFIVAAHGKAIKSENIKWTERIAGGNDAHEGQFSYQVSIQSKDPDIAGHFCGGSIYSDRWIITAGHCTLVDEVENLLVHVGTIDVKSGKIYLVAQKILHPKYNRFSGKNDIGLIQTATTIEFNDFVKPIPLGTDYVMQGSAVASGWGNLAHNGEAPKILQFIELDVIENEDCMDKLEETGMDDRIYDNVVCTVSPKGKGTCENDSGGPLVLDGQLIGVVIWGIPCALGLPDVFARVSSYKEWITSTAV